MLYTNGSFEICQERMFVKQRRKLVNYPSQFLSHLLIRIFNRCINEGTYSNCFKITQILPIYTNQVIKPGVPFIDPYLFYCN